MRDTRTRLLSGAMVWLVPGFVLALATWVWGQNSVAQPPPVGKESPPRAGVLQDPAPDGGGPLKPAVTAERRGRLLVLTCAFKSTGGGLSSNIGPRGEPPTFAIYQGQRKIASGQFEFG